MLKELLAGAWEARTMIPRLVLEFDELHASFVALLERLDRWEKANTELRAEVDALKAPPAPKTPPPAPKAAAAPRATYRNTYEDNTADFDALKAVAAPKYTAAPKYEDEDTDHA